MLNASSAAMSWILNYRDAFHQCFASSQRAIGLIMRAWISLPSSYPYVPSTWSWTYSCASGFTRAESRSPFSSKAQALVTTASKCRFAAFAVSCNGPRRGICCASQINYRPSVFSCPLTKQSYHYRWGEGKMSCGWSCGSFQLQIRRCFLLTRSHFPDWGIVCRIPCLCDEESRLYLP